jgi:hypothetical protein
MAADALPVRSPLDALQTEFPHYQIVMRSIAGRMFYLAEAIVLHVQPRFAQAETTDRLRARLTAPVREFTVTEPSIPRVWDVLLGGKDNFAADRDQAKKLLTVFPRAAELAQESREFQRRAVTYVAGEGVRQFLDLGCGLPTTPNTRNGASGTAGRDGDLRRQRRAGHDACGERAGQHPGSARRRRGPHPPG